jgi:hypothetical protein
MVSVFLSGGFELSLELRFTTLWLGTASAAQPTFPEDTFFPFIASHIV